MGFLAMGFLAMGFLAMGRGLTRLENVPHGGQNVPHSQNVPRRQNVPAPKRRPACCSAPDSHLIVVDESFV